MKALLILLLALAAANCSVITDDWICIRNVEMNGNNSECEYSYFALRKQALKALANSTLIFSDLLSKEVVLANEGAKNMIMSPLSAHIILGMAAYGAQGNTYEQMKKALHLPDDDEFSQIGFNELLDKTNYMREASIKTVKIVTDFTYKDNFGLTRLMRPNRRPKITFELANKIYVAKALEIKSKFKELNKESFKSEIGELEVDQPDKAAKGINSWVKKKTRYEVDEETIKAEEIQGGDNGIILVDAIYLEAEWEKEFVIKDTEERPFNLIDNDLKYVPTMKITDYFLVGKVYGLNARYIRIPYVNNNLVMIVILTDQVDGIYDVIQNLNSLKYSEPEYSKVRLFLPRFKIESTIDLKKPLQKLGMTDMFDNKANFKGISDEPLKVTKILQKALIEVNEHGRTRDAPVTGIIKEYFSFPKLTVPFEVNRPFVFTIVNKMTKTTVFTGTVYEPSF